MFPEPASILIKHTGIEDIEKLSTFFREAVVQQLVSEIRQCANVNLTYFTEDESIELLTRSMMQDDFKNMLEDKLETNVLNDLTKIFFELIYPHPGIDLEKVIADAIGL